MNIKDIWDHIYGKKSHMNLAGKILLGVPMLPFITLFVGTYMLLDFLFAKNKP